MFRVLPKDGSARLDSKKWVDVEVTLSPGDAMTRDFVVILDPICKSASVRYREVDVDGSRYISGESGEVFVIP